jgi:hypothetical protein
MRNEKWKIALRPHAKMALTPPFLCRLLNH